MNRLFLSILIFLLFSVVSAEQYYPDAKCDLVRVIDGDTIVCNIPDWGPLGQGISIRFRHADAPELMTKDPEEKKAAIKAKENIERILNKRVAAGDDIVLKKVGKGKYFRLVAHVYTRSEKGDRFLYVYPKKH